MDNNLLLRRVDPVSYTHLVEDIRQKALEGNNFLYQNVTIYGISEKESYCLQVLFAEYPQPQMCIRDRFDTVKQLKQEQDATSQVVHEKLHAMVNTPQKKIVIHRFEPTSKYCLLYTSRCV